MFSLFLLIVVPLSAQTDTKDNDKYKVITKFDPTRDASKDIIEAISEARKSNRRILLDVGGEWCIWCHRLDELFEIHQDLNKFLHDNFVVVKINFSKENENKEVLSKYPKVAGYPHFFVLNKNGKFLHSQNTGDLEEGKGHDKEKVLSFLKKWAPSKVKQKKVSD
jgi:thioredoxin-related protein